jgi:hypothetical protein
MHQVKPRSVGGDFEHSGPLLVANFIRFRQLDPVQLMDDAETLSTMEKREQILGNN